MLTTFSGFARTGGCRAAADCDHSLVPYAGHRRRLAHAHRLRDQGRSRGHVHALVGHRAGVRRHAVLGRRHRAVRHDRADADDRDGARLHRRQDGVAGDRQERQLHLRGPAGAEQPVEQHLVRHPRLRRRQLHRPWLARLVRTRTHRARRSSPPRRSVPGFEYWIHLDDKRWEVRDAQWLAGGLVQSGMADADRLAITGGSYGGGPPLSGALLAGKTMCGGAAGPGGARLRPVRGQGRTATSCPWTTPDGTTPLTWAVSVPMYTYADLLGVLTPNGRGSDGSRPRAARRQPHRPVRRADRRHDRGALRGGRDERVLQPAAASTPTPTSSPTRPASRPATRSCRPTPSSPAA